MRRDLAAAAALLGIFVGACDGMLHGSPSGTPSQRADADNPTTGGTGFVAAGTGGGLTAGTGLAGGLSGATSVAGSSGGGNSGVAGGSGSGGTIVAMGGSGSDAATGGDESGGSDGDSPSSVAEVFEHCAYGGWQASLPVGDYSSAELSALGAVSGDASSIRVSPGFEVVLYDGDDFTGSALIIDADTDCLVSLSFNDRAVSMRVRTQSDGSGGTGGTGGSAGSGGTSGGSGGTGGTSGGTGGTGGSSGPDHYQACVDRINGFRATMGLPALARRTDKEACADGQAKSDSETGTAHGSFNQCDDWAQNECPGWGSIDDVIENCLQAMWNEGPGGGHYENMIGNRTYVWCGFHTTPDGKVWSVQDFK